MENGTLRRRWLRKAPIVALLGVLALTVFGLVTMLLWNWLMPTLFGLAQIGFWQASGLVILSRVLFGGFRHHGWHQHRWRGRLLARWEQMTPEEREKLREGLHCCHG
jgi:Ca2+/H+ antiporter, TMEM165/GDT1 family